ncbi:MAG TPA: sortase [Anaerolineaceae bacterium]|nr:sortase [Anaerolineaceae bacterium]
MNRKRSVDELTVEELRHLLIEKRRAERRSRIDQYRRTGRLIQLESQPPPTTLGSFSSEEIVLDSEAPPTRMRRRPVWVDRLLLVVELVAVIGLVLVLLNGMDLLRNLNTEVANALAQPTLTPTPLIGAIVLPSGHTPPNAPGGVQFNEGEIPDHLRPLVQSLAEMPLPTPGPEHALRIQIPAIHVDAPVVQGDGWEQLKKGVAQSVINPVNPGQDGNLVLSAHNDVFGEIFRDLDKLEEGDEIILYTSQRAYVYVVKTSEVVEPTQVEVMAPTADPVVTLISCYPYLVDNKRIVIVGALQEQRS